MPRDHTRRILIADRLRKPVSSAPEHTARDHDEAARALISNAGADPPPPSHIRCRAPISRIIRFRDAPRYLGMDRNRFNAEVRPCVTEVRIGQQGVAFDRLELDAWVDEYFVRNGRPGRTKGATSWDANETPASRGGQDDGSSTNGSAGNVFAKALAQISLKKLNGTSRE